MKTLFITLSLLLTFTLTNAQTINDKPISEIDSEYMQIVGTGKMLSNKVNIQIDFGQFQKFMSSKNVIKDKDGKLMDFNSMIDALNFMSGNGYEFVTAYTLTVGNQNVYHYLLRKREG